ncbi:hypothetical protein AT746_12445 [Lacimicrobium alkaliphilum]|uniref:Uncharacterized protein n=1 Tax=Lacimicrobium alkaliphilum TaxID=1526571 RepID=A0A0U3AJR1_9ALTE|nr:hypothetical protein AT746_12445 [Lacimicrobium alkaliphilum]
MLIVKEQFAQKHLQGLSQAGRAFYAIRGHCQGVLRQLVTLIVNANPFTFLMMIAAKLPSPSVVILTRRKHLTPSKWRAFYREQNPVQGKNDAFVSTAHICDNLVDFSVPNENKATGHCLNLRNSWPRVN